MNYVIEASQKAGKKITEKWIGKIVKFVLGKIGKKNAEISVAIVGDQEMKKLNKAWRGKNKVTDVLSFIYEEKPLVGEIIICYPQASRQAKKRGVAVGDEIRLLLVHGVLHLCGYDHELGETEARKMENTQNKIIKFLKN